MDDDSLSAYMADATERLVRKVSKDIVKSPSTALFLAGFKRSSARASEKRKGYQSKGIHIPGFLICSITDKCNLRCKGCYAVSNGICGGNKRLEMTDQEWDSLFGQAEDLGISFMILAGGEPLMRMGVVEMASEHRDVVFPVFTNGILIPERIGFFRKNRNMIPIVSIDGPEEITDERRGEGVYGKVKDSMDLLSKNGILHGASITAMSDNLDEITSDEFIEDLHKMGVAVAFFIEFVPSKDTMHLALGDEGRERLSQRIKELRNAYQDMVFMSFPGDEKHFGGCIGAGRGFIHINPYGDAEACPASPVSDRNLKECTLAEAIASPLFLKIRASGAMELPHKGGCALAENKEEMIRIIQ